MSFKHPMHKIEHTSADGIKYEPNKKLGYYLVNNNIYYNKFQALLDASKTNDTVKWFFNEDAFVKFPWHTEPQVPLNELYRLRAQQLRDQYDYIRVEASGGSDSTTVIYSFLLNDIPLDEVVFRYPKQGEKGVSGDPWDTRAENTLSEWEFAAKPLLNWIKTNHPQVKVTVDDYSETMMKSVDKKDESWILRTRHYLQPGHHDKYGHFNLKEHREIADSGRRIAVVMGTDKPKVCIKDKKFFLYFSDAQTQHDPNVEDYTNITNEYFFWSPDSTEMIAKQAHMIRHWFTLPQNNKLQSALHWPNSSFATRSLYEQLVRNIIYDQYDSSTFQTLKPTNNIYNEMDHWFHANMKGTKMYATWQAGIDYLINNLDSKYIMDLQGRPANIMTYTSPLYYFGECTIPEQIRINTRELIKNERQKNAAPTTIHVIEGRIVIY